MVIQLGSEKPSQELSIEEVLTHTFELYSRKFITFLIPILVAALISGSFSALITSYIKTMPPPEPGASQEAVWNWLWSYLTTLLALAFIVGITSWIISTIANGVCIKFAADLIEKGNASFEEAFNFTVYKLLSLLAVAIITGVLIALGVIALIVPGIILAIMFSLVVPVIMIEDVGALDSLSRSRRLVSNSWLKTFALLLIVGIIILFAGFIGNLIGTPFGDMSLIVSSIISAFAEPVLPISLTVYYYSMLAKETQQRALPPPPPPF